MSSVNKKKVYSNEDLVESYDKRRFGGQGGKYVVERDYQIVSNLLKESGKTILDIPCGTGILSSKLQENGYKITLADASMRMIKKSQKKVEGSNVISSDITNLPFKDNSFDATITLRLFQHYPKEDISRFLDELRRVVRPTGRIIFDTFRWSPRNTPFFKGKVHTYADTAVEELLIKQGLELVEKKSAYLISPIIYRYLPLEIIRVIDALERFVGPNQLVRNFWCCKQKN